MDQPEVLVSIAPPSKMQSPQMFPTVFLLNKDWPTFSGYHCREEPSNRQRMNESNARSDRRPNNWRTVLPAAALTAKSARAVARYAFSHCCCKPLRSRKTEIEMFLHIFFLLRLRNIYFVLLKRKSSITMTLWTPVMVSSGRKTALEMSFHS